MPSAKTDISDMYDINWLALCLKALGHPVRLKLIEQLQYKDMPCCGDICDCFSFSQSTISQHLSVLMDAGLVECKKIGNKSHYTLKHAAYREVLEQLQCLEQLKRTPFD